MSAAAATAMPAMPQEPLTSEHWFRVSALKPQLDPLAKVQRVLYRRQVWHVLTRSDGSRSFRLNASAYAFVARCNGQNTLQRLWELLLAELRDEAPTQDELLRLLARLHAAALMSFDRRPDFGSQGLISEPLAAGAAAQTNSLLSYKVPFGRPEPIFAWVYPRIRGVFSPLGLAVWLLVVGLGALLALLNLGVLSHHAMLMLDTPRYLLLTWFCYPVVKTLHEVGHGMAVKRLGAEVPEWGVTVMMFVPVPYVDATGTSAYADRSDRALVSAAGIMTELFLAALGLIVALNAQPGWVHDIGMSVFFIGAVSSVLINGNPLMRFDGYHVLCDALELPNLASRSARHWLVQLRQRLLREPGVPGLVPAHGERPWLWAYAPASLLWRFAVAAALVTMMGNFSFVIGTAVALLLGWGMVVRPLGMLGRHLFNLGGSSAAGRLAQRRGLGVVAAVVLGLCAVPLPFASVVPGVVWLPEPALLRVQTDGFVQEVLARDGQTVQPGQPLLRLSAPTLEAEAAVLVARAQGLQAERHQAIGVDNVRAAAMERELAALQVDIDRAERKLAHLELRAQHAGRLVLPRQDDLPGRWLKQGALVGHVMSGERSIVRVAVGQEQAALLQQSGSGISVWLAESGREAMGGELLRDGLGAVHKLPSAALGDRGGGPVVTDPKDPHGLQALQAQVMADVRLPVSLGEPVGGRAWVRFDHGSASAAYQAARAVQLVFLRHFSPAQ